MNNSNNNNNPIYVESENKNQENLNSYIINKNENEKEGIKIGKEDEKIDVNLKTKSTKEIDSSFPKNWIAFKLYDIDKNGIITSSDLERIDESGESKLNLISTEFQMCV